MEVLTVSPLPARRGHSLARPIFLLVVAAILTATAVTFAITFAGPPPRPAPVALADVAAALKGAVPVNPEGQGLRARPGAPVARADERADQARDARLAALLGGGEVRGFYAQPARGRDAAIRGAFVVGWRQPGNEWMRVESLPDTLFARWLTVTLGGMLAALAVMAAAAWAIARAITRPLRALADAAEAARPGDSLPPVPPGTPREVAELAGALHAMQRRIGAQVEGRTAMLAAIAHDLGTPLTRIAFWIEQLPDAACDRAAADVAEMRDMLGAVLRFARDERVERRARVDLGSVLDSLIDDLAAAGQPVTLAAGERALVNGDAPALRRLFANLIDNAIRYGARAAVGWTVAPGQVVVTVDDAGPGFDPALGERAFEPFVRGEPSRNRATGGSGLGLAIVRSLVEAHGGTVALGRGPDGGRVTMVLPLA